MPREQAVVEILSQQEQPGMEIPDEQTVRRQLLEGYIITTTNYYYYLINPNRDLLDNIDDDVTLDGEL